MAAAEAWRLCATCGVENDLDEDTCAICAEERQYVPAGGQRWTTLGERAAEGFHVEITEVEPDCYTLHAVPRADVGQSAMLVRTPHGNLLWEVPGHVDEADREWVRRWGADGEITTWSEPFDVLPGIRVLQPGGHFPGSSVAVWAAGAEGRGVLLSGDTCKAVPDAGWVSFMRSFPNLIPLSAAVVTRVADTLAGLTFDRLYDNFGLQVPTDARDVVRRSAQRYAAWVGGDHDHLT